MIFSQKTLKEHKERVLALIAQDKAATVDRLRTEVRLAGIEEEVLRAKNLLEIQKRKLVNLLGVTGPSKEGSKERGAGITLTGELEDSVLEPSESIDEDLQKALSERDDYLAARELLRARASNLAAARAEKRSEVYLQGSYGSKWDGEDFGKSEDGGSISLGLELPLFRGGEIPAQIRSQKNLYKGARERLRRLRLAIRLDIETARLSIDAAKERVAANAKAIEQGKEGLRIERLKYRNAKASITDVLDAQDDLLNAQTKYHDALADLNIAAAKRREALGREDYEGI